jgi:hypothetical protein
MVGRGEVDKVLWHYLLVHTLCMSSFISRLKYKCRDTYFSHLQDPLIRVGRAFHVILGIHSSPYGVDLLL